MKVGDPVTVVHCYCCDQRREAATIEKVVEMENGHPLLIVIGRVFHRHPKPGEVYNGGDSTDSPLSLVF